jgi:hypothetical protein
VIPVYNEQKILYGGDKKNFVITRDSLYISLFTYKLSLFDFAKLFVITEEMYVVRYNQVRYKQVSLYSRNEAVYLVILQGLGVTSGALIPWNIQYRNQINLLAV